MSVWQPGPRPDWIQSLHEVADPAWIRLDADEILADVQRKTGLSDFGGEDFLEPFRIFVKSVDEESQTHAVGRLIARSDLENWLINRLELTETRKRHPEIDAEVIDKPIFITGLPRTGTSILHELLAQDPGHRAPQHWEVRHPCPPPETATYGQDDRIQRAARQVDLWSQIVPEYSAMHELGAQIPVECIQITAHSFVSDELLGRHQVPSYGAWYAGADLEPAYAYHRYFLQHLQWRCPPADRWVLKAPSHLGALGALLAVYPDARIVVTHRDPLKVLPSVASILYSTAFVRSDAIDPNEVLAWFTPETCLYLLDSMTALRDSGGVAPEQIVDVRYQDLMRDPIQTLASVYEHFGFSFREEASTRMAAYLEAKPKGKHGTHDYSFDDTGLNVVEERARFEAYQARFGVPTELS